MSSSRMFLCGGASMPAKWKGKAGNPIVLSANRNSGNINLQIEDVSKKLFSSLPSRLVDLLEIAAYVFSADCAVKRDRAWNVSSKPEPWDRVFRFSVRVRDHAFWKDKKHKELLISTLGFLSDDEYDFEFQKQPSTDDVRDYFEYSSDDTDPFAGVERVSLFSGGLDSLAGAMTQLSNDATQKVVLVSHRSVGQKDSLQKKLAGELLKLFPGRVLHVPVWVYKDGNLGREHTQRTRSFLFASLATTVAGTLNAKGIRFYENGVISLNLPVADEVVRARASRTTHPKTLHSFQELFSVILGRSLIVDNPFLFETKAEVIGRLLSANGGALIGKSVSCAHTAFLKKGQPHCGRCSQCIDRRIAIIASKATEFDSEIDYETDVFTGARFDPRDVSMSVDFARYVTELSKMSDVEIASKYNLNLSRAARPMPNRAEAIANWIAMLKRFATYAVETLDAQLKASSQAVVCGTLEGSSLLGKIIGKEHLQSNWRRLANRLIEILRLGVPPVCQKHMPKNEPHLQQICDGIFSASGEKLRREFPYLPWATKLTKPDFYAKEMSLLLELKYIRSKADVAKVLADIAEDITKYGDNNCPVLFIIYDPYRHVTNDDQFLTPIRARVSMLGDFVR